MERLLVLLLSGTMLAAMGASRRHHQTHRRQHRAPEMVLRKRERATSTLSRRCPRPTTGPVGVAGDVDATVAGGADDDDVLLGAEVGLDADAATDAARDGLGSPRLVGQRQLVMELLHAQGL